MTLYAVSWIYENPYKVLWSIPVAIFSVKSMIAIAVECSWSNVRLEPKGELLKWL